MNIFVLSSNPVIAASYHCDQHLHKMILESAQMLSTSARTLLPSIPKSILYKPAYENHPCTIWLSSSLSHMVFVCTLATTLDEIRICQGSNRHSSMDIIQAVQDWLPKDIIESPTTFAEAMYPHIKVRKDLNTVEKYQLYYRKKHLQWKLDTGRGMSYKNRPIPEFLVDLI